MSNETTFAKKVNENNIKVLFPEGIETITISKNDYDRLFGQLTYENIILKSKIEKAYAYLDKFVPNEYGVLLTERQWQYVKDILKENE